MSDLLINKIENSEVELDKLVFTKNILLNDLEKLYNEIYSIESQIEDNESEISDFIIIRNQLQNK